MALKDFDVETAHLFMLEGPTGVDQAIAYIYKHLRETIVRIIKKKYSDFRHECLEELLNDVLLAFRDAVLDKKYDPERPDSHPLRYISAIASNKACDEHRRQQRQRNADGKLTFLAREFPQAQSAYQQVSDKEIKQVITSAMEKAIAELPYEQRIVVTAWWDMHSDGEPTWEEITSELRGRYPGTPFTVNQVQKLFSRGTQSLQPTLRHFIQ